ncbi:MAG: CBS domain-containing protein, partial [Chloroflexi bacterium]
MLVRDAMSRDVLVVGGDQTVSEAAGAMIRRHVGAAVVTDDSTPGPGIITERDVMRAVGEGRDPAATTVREVMTFEARTASVAWDLDQAAAEMVRNNFRHLLVVDEHGDIAGVVSMRDI